MAGIELPSAFNNPATLTNTSQSDSVNKAAKSCHCHLSQDSNKHLAQKRQTKANNCCSLKQTHPTLTLCLVVMMAFIVIMPHDIEAAAVRRHLSASAAADNVATSSQKSSVKIEKLLLLSEAIEELAEDYINEDSSLVSESESGSSLSASIDSVNSASYDELSPLEVAKHMERLAEHQKDLKSKLYKRQAQSLHNLRHFDGSSHKLVWHNPCNVVEASEVADSTATASSSRKTYYYLKKLKEDIRKEFITNHLSLKHIKIDDMESWRLYRDYYAFLPKVKQNSSISLSRWYSNMQVFVASFAYLGKAQFEWDTAKRQYIGDTTKELDLLLTSARLMLCSLESTINGSQPSRNLKMLKSFSRDAMDDKLQFQTKEQQRNGVALVEPAILDLKFAKNAYFKYLAGMRKVLKRKLKSKGQAVKADSTENTSGEFNKNAGDVSQSLDISSMMRSDSNMSLGESFEHIVKSAAQKPTEKKSRKHHKNAANRKSAELPAL